MNYKEIYKENEKQFYIDLDNLLKIKSVYDCETISINKPFGNGCFEVLEFMKKLCNRDNIEYREYDGYALSIHLNSECTDTFAILAHLDVVPAYTKKEKSNSKAMYDPFKLTKDNNRLYGRGILDNKGPALMSYYIFKILKEKAIKLNKHFILILGVDEERGMSCIKHYKEKGIIPKQGYTPDADFPLIYGEKGICNFVINVGNIEDIIDITGGEALNVVLDNVTCEINKKLDINRNSNINIKYEDNKTIINVLGKASHACEPTLGINAGGILFEYLSNIFDNTKLLTISKLVNNLDGSELDIKCVSSEFDGITINLGKVDCDNGINLYFDFRYPIEINIKKIEEKINKYCNNNSFKYKLIKNSNPLYVNPNSSLVKNLFSVYNNIVKDNSRPFTIGGGTYARMFDNFVGFGPIFINSEDELVGKIHQDNEGVKEVDFIKAFEIYFNALITINTMNKE